MRFRLPRRSLDWRSPWTMFWVALVLRVLYITVARSYVFHGGENHFHFGWEMGRVAAALAAGHGYADPYVPNTGPTAWVPPLYPFLLAGVFKLFGTYTLLSGWVILSINSIFSAATIPAIYKIAARCYGRRTALWSGWLWALYPAAMQYAVRWVWEMSLTCLLLAWVIVLALDMGGIGDAGDRRPARTWQWVVFGLLWGLIALSNPAVLLFLPPCGIWILLRSSNTRHELAPAALSALLFLVILGSWTYRNYATFHEFIPIRDNLGAELWAGSGPGSTGLPVNASLPVQASAPETVLYKQMGEAAYVKMQGDKAKAYISAHLGHYLLISLKRFYFYWAGVPHPAGHFWSNFFRELNYCFLSIAGILGLALSLRKRTPAAGLFLWAFLTIPLTYYFVTPGARFRHPIEPLIDIFAVYLFQSATRRWRTSRIHLARGWVRS